jgi:phosphopantothenoylcysteine synthetase/decarboxylase
MTHTATQFLPARTVALFADQVLSDPEESFTTNHVSLAAQQDLIIVLPASAHILALVAGGQAANLITRTILAARCPVVFLPAMNSVMWNKPAVQRNVAQLREDGYEVLEPDWSDRFDLSTRQMAANPTLPTPRRVAELIAERMPGPGQPPASPLAQPVPAANPDH